MILPPRILLSATALLLSSRNFRASLASSSTAMASDSKNIIGGGAINEKPRLYKNNNDDPSNTNSFDKDDHCGWDPTRNVSHILHAIVGLDRYPNYISRFQNVNDVIALEDALKDTLEKVGRQKRDLMDRRSAILDLVRRYNTILNDGETEGGAIDTAAIKAREHCHEFDDNTTTGIWLSKLLKPPHSWVELKRRNILSQQAFNVVFQSVNVKSKYQNSHDLVDVMNGKVDVDLNTSLLEEFIDQEMFDVYSFPLFSREFCHLIRQTIRELTEICDSDEEFNHIKLGDRPVDLDSIGLGWIIDMIFNMFICPISKHLFAKSEQLESKNTHDTDNKSSTILDWRHGYVAGYSASPAARKGATRHKLVSHTDDSEVTLNCCLGEEDYKGGHVQFFGMRGTEGEGRLIGTVERPNVGTALLHSGRHLHSVTDMLSGDRYALIIWARSWSNCRKATCPCCYLNRRQDRTCICARQWN